MYPVVLAAISVVTSTVALGMGLRARNRVRGSAWVFFVLVALCVPGLAILNMTGRHERLFQAISIVFVVSFLGFFLTARRSRPR